MSADHESIVHRLAQILVKLNQGQLLDPKQLSDEFGVNLRTVQRDLNQRFSYLPLIKENGKYKLDGYALGKLNTKDIQRFANLSGIQGLFPSLRDEFLRDIFDGHISSALLVRGHHYEDISSREQDFRLLEQAIASCSQVKFRYLSTGSRKASRTVDPYRLINHKCIWYLAAVEASKLKTFAFTKLSDPSQLESNFLPDSEIKAKLETDEGIWIGDQSIEVVLKVAPQVASYFKRRSLVANQVIDKELSDGGLIITSSVGHPNQILPIVRYWIPYVSIISPEHLQKDLMQALKQYCDC